MKVSIIIPYKVDRGWLNEAMESVWKDKDVQLILSKGNGNWPQNFNKGLKEATGEYIKFLHEDDKLNINCIQDSLKCFEETGADFIHGNAIEIFPEKGLKKWVSPIPIPTLGTLLRKNTIHSTTLMYKREIFEKIGGFNESPNVYSFEEFEFNLRCLAAGFKIGYCNSFLAYYRRHPKQIIRTVDKQDRLQNRRNLIKQYHA